MGAVRPPKAQKLWVVLSFIIALAMLIPLLSKMSFIIIVANLLLAYLSLLSTQGYHAHAAAVKRWNLRLLADCRVRDQGTGERVKGL
jgi:hypothetical protein